jgi:hypothetical protein
VKKFLHVEVAEELHDELFRKHPNKGEVSNTVRELLYEYLKLVPEPDTRKKQAMLEAAGQMRLVDDETS